MSDKAVIGYPFHMGGTWYLLVAGDSDVVLELRGQSSLLFSTVVGKLCEIGGEELKADRGGGLTFLMKSLRALDETTPNFPPVINIDPWKVVEAEVRKSAPNWRLIEAASREFVDDDPDRVRFSVDAAHVQRLGEQLVSKQETALSELIKNAYDADATTVTLRFAGHDKVGGILAIEDDGVGMTEDVIRACRKFLRLTVY